MHYGVRPTPAGVVCSWFLLFTAIIAVVRQKFPLIVLSKFPRPALNAHWKSRHSGLREPRRYRPRRKQTQECYGKCARSHRACGSTLTGSAMNRTGG
jgi:hypothetical protein